MLVCQTRQQFVQTTLSLEVTDTPPLTNYGALMTLLKMDHLRLFRLTPELMNRSESGTFLVGVGPVKDTFFHEFRNRHTFDR